MQALLAIGASGASAGTTACPSAGTTADTRVGTASFNAGPSEPAVPGLCRPDGREAEPPERRQVLRVRDVASLRRDEAVRGSHEVELGSPQQSQGQGFRLQCGAISSLRPELLAAARTIDEELLSALEATTRAGHCDLLEVATTRDSGLASRIEATGGTAYRASIWNDYDLTTTTGKDRLKELVRQMQPRHLWFSPPCTPWTQLQVTNQRTPEQCARLAASRRRGRRILNAIADIIDWGIWLPWMASLTMIPSPVQSLKRASQSSLNTVSLGVVRHCVQMRSIRDLAICARNFKVNSHM